MDALTTLRGQIAGQDDLLGHLVFRYEDTLGVIYCEEAAEDADSHCEVCRDELTVFRPRGPSPDLPHYYMAVIGPTKFARIQAGWRDTLGFDLKRVEFINDDGSGL